MKRHFLRPRAAAFAVPALVMVLGLLASCSEQPDGSAGTVQAGAAGPAGSADLPAAPEAKAGPVAPRPRASEPEADREERLPAGLTRIGEARPDPELALDAKPPGEATMRWGESGRDVTGAAPWRGLAYDGIHERGSDAIGILQEPRVALQSLPRARSGNLVDWAAALRQGAIRPRAGVGGPGSIELRDQDIRFTDTRSMPVVTFPHLVHTEWLSCRNCHDRIFVARRGANDITMADIARGRACGVCHGKVAFPATDCFRCHNGPRPQGQG